MHFIGILAFRLPIEVLYDIRFTVFSMLVAIIVSGLGLVFGSRDSLGMGWLVGGGLLVGIGIVSMNYIGLEALQIEPRIRYQPGLLALSILIAVGAAILSLWCSHTLRMETIFSAFQKKAGSAVIMGMGFSLLRVAAAVREKHGRAPIGDLYTDFGTRIHIEKDAPSLRTTEGIAEILAKHDLDPALADAAESDAFDDIVRADTELALARAGRDIGTPVLTFSPPDGYSFFGPVIAKAPTGADAVKLWDSVRTLAEFPGFAELKRSIRNTPEADFFLFEDRAYNALQVNERIDNVVRGLIAIGVRRGEHVGVLMNTRPSALAVAVALSRLGAVAVICESVSRYSRPHRLCG